MAAQSHPTKAQWFRGYLLADIAVSCRQKTLARCRAKKGWLMMPDPVALFATVVLLFPMGFFLMSAPAFLLVSLDIPPVTQLLRGLFSAYFMMVAIAGAVGTICVAFTGRIFLAIGIAAIAGFAVWARGWFLPRMDAQLSARDAGDTEAVRELRRLHWGVMACNAVQLAVLVSAIPYVVMLPRSVG